MPPTHTEAGLEAAREIGERHPDIGVLVLSHGDGECVVDPTSVSRLFARRRGALEDLSGREREVLALMAEGHSNEGIGERLFLSPRTVETRIRQIFLKLGLRETPAYHRRVVAVLTFLRSD